MKNIKTMMSLILVGCAVSAAAEWGTTNRLTVATRYGFNIKGGFQYAPGAVAAVPRFTPDGDVYNNYDDGYVLTDISGNAGGLTSYWGYDDAAQVVGNEILMSSTSLGAGGDSAEMDPFQPFVGVEVIYSGELEANEKHRFGMDFGLSFMPMDFNHSGPVATTATTTTDAYGFDPADTPPGAPHQGTYAGFGYMLLDAAPSGSTTTTAAGPTLMGHSRLEGTLWALRIGPYLEQRITDTFSLRCSGGLTVGWLDVDAHWSTEGATPTRGSGHDSEVLSGAFIGANAVWFLSDQWGATVGAQYEYLNDWRAEFDGHTATIDFTRSLYATLGIFRQF